MEKKEPKLNRSIDRAVTLLIQLSDGDMSLAELCSKTEIDNATAYRMLYTMEQRGFVQKSENTLKYCLGPKLLGLAFGKLYHSKILIETAYPHMNYLWKLTGETINLYIRDNLSRVCVEEMVSENPLKYSVGVGVSVPLYTGSAGKILLAYLPPDELEEYLSKVELVALTKKTITSKTSMLKELEEIRSCGYATSFGERIEGVSCLSAPVFDKTGRIVASLNILGPYLRLEKQKLMSYLDELLKEANAITDKFKQGY